MYIKISGRARTGGKYSAPTIIQTSCYFEDFLVAAHGRASFLISAIGYFWNAIVLNFKQTASFLNIFLHTKKVSYKI